MASTTYTSFTAAPVTLQAPARHGLNLQVIIMATSLGWTRLYGYWVVSSLVLSLSLLFGCATNSEQTPRIQSYDHGQLWATEFFLVNGVGSPRVGIDPRGTEIESVTLEWGKAPPGYAGYFIYAEQEGANETVPATQAGYDPTNANVRIWSSKFAKYDDTGNTKGMIADGERYDYRFVVRYRPQGTDNILLLTSGAQSVYVAPGGGTIQLTLDPHPPGQTVGLGVGEQTALQVRLSSPSVLKRTVTLSASPANLIQFFDNESGEQIHQLTFEPQHTYRDLFVRAVGVNSPYPGDLVTLKGTSNGWRAGERELQVTP